MGGLTTIRIYRKGLCIVDYDFICGIRISKLFTCLWRVSHAETNTVTVLKLLTGLVLCATVLNNCRFRKYLQVA